LKVHVLIKILEALKEINQVDSFHCYWKRNTEVEV
jgi:hypothetical protein